ncbi:EH domain-containing protein 1, partial [Perkinsus olseni]
MLRWLKADAERAQTTETFRNISDGLQEIYRDKLLPIEEYYDFHRFYSAPLTPADFTAKPMVMLIGQYSTGKTTFIRHLLERDYPGMRIGPEPTTDNVTRGTIGDVPGNALVVDRTLPFTQLSQFGNGFMNRFEASMMEGSPVLQGVTFIDTPGILSGEKQRLQRGYDFEGVVNWFADRVDMILLLFDAHKLDISDEFRRCILACGQNENKIRIVLNKSDMVTTQQLMRVYGALMWSLGKVINTPETSRVFIGSFWDEKLNNDEQRNLFEKEESDLYADIAKLPEEAALRKLNDLIKRARLAKTHACLMTYIKHEMPSMFGKNSKKRELIEHLDEVYEQVSK